MGLRVRACMAICIHLCVILWTRRSSSAAGVGGEGHRVLKVPVSRPSVLWLRGVGHGVLSLVQPETPSFFCYPVGTHKKRSLLLFFLTKDIYALMSLHPLLA